MNEITPIFAALADPIRLRCLALIVAEGELCVCELVQALDLPQPKISRHLASLRDAGVLSDRRDAQWVLYARDPEMADWVHKAVDAAVLAVAAEREHLRDIKRLRKASRPSRAKARQAA